MVSSERGQASFKWALYGILILAFVMAIISVASGLIMDYYWFGSVGFLQVFLINIKYQLALLFIGWIATTSCLLLSWRTIKKALGEQLPASGGPLFKIFSVIIGFGVGWWFKGEYLTVLKFLNRSPWGVSDPVFGHDVSFYVFTLPVIRTAITFVAAVSGLVIFLSLLTYGVGRMGIETSKGEVDYSGESSFWPPARFLKSWPILGSVLALSLVGAISIWLGRYSYLWSFSSGASVPTGASYMAVNYFIPYTWIKAIGAILLGALFIRVLLYSEEIRERLEFGEFGELRKEIALVAAVIIIFLLIPGALFGAINALAVEPNEPGIQRPYLERTIEFTNRAYDLDDINEVTYPSSSQSLSLEEALESPTVNNARIVDYRPIKVTYEEKQRLRTYYEFHDVDVDRYETGEGKQLAVISGREMDYKEGSWQNQHLFFTHGFGAVVSPASRKQPDGSPILRVGDIPPVSDWGATEIGEPRIYFGERTNSYAMVRAEGLDEFDYPKGEKNEYYRFEFDRGIELGSPWKKLIGWLYTGDFKILVSDYVGPESRLLLHRNVHDRVRKIAPFLFYDPNAHLFIGEEGDLNYLLNGITWAGRYPYSYSDGGAPGYLSDSVKGFVKSNTGDVEFYIVDDEDPMARTFSKIYPGLFEDDEDMAEDYRRHLVYPPTLFDTQMRIFRRYHMKDYQSFYQQEDLWTPAEEKYHGMSKRLEAYNILLDVTGQPGFEDRKEEFTLIRPFTPKGKKNMRAWVGVAQDPGNYGRMIAIKFPKGELARGPMQVEAIIDQDPEISQQFTLWEGAGSRVLRGNLLVLPVKDDVLYIEPVYLSAETLPYPQLKRVVAVYGDRAAMENDLVGAVASALGRPGVVRPPENIVPGENLAPVELVQTVQQYLDLMDEYNELISEQRYAEAGGVRENMAELERRMEELTR